MYNLTDISVIKDICSKYNFSFSKSLGQNFIINPSVCPKIAQMGGAEAQVGVIEIGTGFGVLTKELALRAKKVVAVEIDNNLLPVLEDTLSDFSNIKIINNDVLKVDLHKLIQDEFPDTDVVICANLPYYVTSPILMSLLESRLPVKSITVMIQREAAVRICSDMGKRECGAVTAAVRYYSEPEILFNVSRGSFFPAPNVDSCVVRLNIKEHTPENVVNEKFLFKVIRKAFEQRRKTLPNPLSALGIKKADIIQCMEKINLKPTARAEELSLENFIELSNLLYKEVNQNE